MGQERLGESLDLNLFNNRRLFEHILCSSRTAAVKRIRREPRRDTVGLGNCLDNHDFEIEFSNQSYVGPNPMLWFGLGSSVFGSQMSTSMHHLQDLSSLLDHQRLGGRNGSHLES